MADLPETKAQVEDYGLAKAAEEQRMDQRREVLENEYRDIHRHTGPSGVAAADQLANVAA